MKNRKALAVCPEEYRGPWLLCFPSGAGQSFSKADEFVVALRKALTEATDMEQLFAIWERNVDTVRAINKQTTAQRREASLLRTWLRISRAARSLWQNRMSTRRPIP